MTFRLPGDSDRIAIMGHTGSGKTQAGAWHLSKRSFDKMPWITLNFKRDELLSEIEELGGKSIDVDDKVPKKPGLYFMDILPGSDDEMEAFLQKIWEKGETGLYVDEGYMIKNRSLWFRRVITQGRSLKIPLIVLSQKPSYVDRFAFSEADFHQVFFLQDKRDIDTAENFVPISKIRPREFAGLPDFHSLYYDVKKRVGSVLRPVPDRDMILNNFALRLKPRRSFFF